MYEKLKISVNSLQLCGYPDIYIAKTEGYRIRKTINLKKLLCDLQGSKLVKNIWTKLTKLRDESIVIHVFI